VHLCHWTCADAHFDAETCLGLTLVNGAAPFWRVLPTPSPSGPLSAVQTVDLKGTGRFVWLVARETLGESGLRVWSIRLDSCSPGLTSLGFGVSGLSPTAVAGTAYRLATTGYLTASRSDAKGLYFVNHAAKFMSGTADLTPWISKPKAPTVGSCAAAATATPTASALGVATARDIKVAALTPLSHYLVGGAGDDGLVLTFSVDLPANRLSLQLWHPTDSPTLALRRVYDGADPDPAWFDPARDMPPLFPRASPSEVLTVIAPADLPLRDCRPAMLLCGAMTVSEVESPPRFPLDATGH
jgi:hypothetical protein